MDYKLHNKKLHGFEGAQETHEDLKSYECDILIPSAMEKTINHKNVDQIKAKVRIYFHSISLTFTYETHSDDN